MQPVQVTAPIEGRAARGRPVEAVPCRPAICSSALGRRRLEPCCAQLPQHLQNRGASGFGDAVRRPSPEGFLHFHLPPSVIFALILASCIVPYGPISLVIHVSSSGASVMRASSSLASIAMLGSVHSMNTSLIRSTYVPNPSMASLEDEEMRELAALEEKKGLYGWTDDSADYKKRKKAIMNKYTKLTLLAAGGDQPAK